MIDINYNKNEINLDIEIIEILDTIGYMRRKDLINYLLENKKENEIGKSNSTITRAISYLVKMGDIKKLKKENFKEYGINDNSKNASYLISERGLEIKKHLDNVFSDFRNSRNNEKEFCLIEIDSHKGYSLNPKQLNDLVNILDSSNTKLSYTAMRIIYNHFKKFNRFPEDIPNFKLKLKESLKINHNKLENQYRNLRTYIIYFLGYFQEKIIIEQLIKDINNYNNLEQFKVDFMHEYTAKLIDDNREKLYNLQKNFYKNGNESKDHFLREIRYSARKILYKNKYKPKTEMIDGKEVEFI